MTYSEELFDKTAENDGKDDNRSADHEEMGKGELGAKSSSTEHDTKPTHALEETQQASPAERAKASSLGIREALYAAFVPALTFTEFTPQDPADDKAATLVGNNSVSVGGVTYSPGALVRLEQKFKDGLLTDDTEKEALARAIYMHLHTGVGKGISQLTNPRNGWVEEIKFNGEKIEKLRFRDSKPNEAPMAASKFLHGAAGEEFVKRYIWAREQLQAFRRPDLTEVNDKTTENNLHTIDEQIARAARRGAAAPMPGAPPPPADAPAPIAPPRDAPAVPAAPVTPVDAAKAAEKYGKAVADADSETAALFETKLYIAQQVGARAGTAKSADFQTALDEAVTNVKTALKDNPTHAAACIRAAEDLSKKFTSGGKTTPDKFYMALRKDLATEETNLDFAKTIAGAESEAAAIAIARLYTAQLAAQSFPDLKNAPRSQFRIALNEAADQVKEALKDNPSHAAACIAAAKDLATKFRDVGGKPDKYYANLVHSKGYRINQVDDLLDSEANPQDVYNKLWKVIPPHVEGTFSWGTLDSFTRQEMTRFAEAVGVEFNPSIAHDVTSSDDAVKANGEAFDELNKVYEKFKEIYPNVRKHDATWRDFAGSWKPATYLLDPIGTWGTAAYVANRVLNKYTGFGLTKERLQAGIARVFTKDAPTDQVKITPQDRVAVVDQVLDKMQKEGITTWDGVVKRLENWRITEAINKGQTNAYLDVASIAAQKAQEASTGAKVQAPGEFLRAYVAADRTSASASRGGRRGAGDAAAPPITPARPAADPAADKESMKRNVTMNLLKNGHDRGIPMGYAEGWDALEQYLEANEDTYLEGANDAQKEGYKELRVEVTRLTGDAEIAIRNGDPVVSPAEHYAAQIEPYGLAVEKFQIASLGTPPAAPGGAATPGVLQAAGVNVNLSTKAAYRAAAEALQEELRTGGYSIDEQAWINEKIVDPMLGEYFKPGPDPTMSVGDFVVNATDLPAWRDYNRQIALPNDVKTNVLEKYYRDGYVRRVETDGTAGSTGSAQYKILLDDCDQKINDLRIDTTKEATKGAREVVAVPATATTPAIAAVPAKPSNIRPDCVEQFDALARIKSDLEAEMSKIRRNSARPAAGAKPQAPVEINPLGKVLLGGLPVPHPYTLLRSVPGSDKYADVTLDVATSGTNPRVTGVTIIDPLTRNRESLTLAETRDRIVRDYTEAGNHTAAEAVKSLKDKDLGVLLTEHARGLDANRVNDRVGGGRLASVVYVSKWVLGGSLAIAGMAMLPDKKAGAAEVSKTPIVPDGLTPKR